MSDDVVIGKFGRPHGVNGEVRFFAYNPDSALLEPGIELQLTGCSLKSVTVAKLRSADKFEILTIDGIGSREEAERLRNAEASVPRSALPEPEPDEFYLVDVIGFEVWGASSINASVECLGCVKGWLDLGSTDIMAVTGPAIKGRMLVPYSDQVVDRIDFDTQRVMLLPLDTWAPED